MLSVGELIASLVVMVIIGTPREADVLAVRCGRYGWHFLSC